MGTCLNTFVAKVLCFATISIHLLAFEANAFRIVRDRQVQDISLQSEILEDVVVGTPWSTQTAFDVYSQAIGAEKVYNINVLDAVITATMFLRFTTAPVIAAQEFLIDPLPKATRKTIRESCLSKYKGDPWKLLVCTNQNVTYMVAEMMEAQEIGGLLTACRAISSTVQLIYNSYNIPRSRVSISNILMSVDGKYYGHAINTVTFLSASGVYYGYAFDAASPSNFYPNTINTIRYHENNGQNLPQDIGQKDAQIFFRPK